MVRIEEDECFSTASAQEEEYRRRGERILVRTAE
jgi:hypothetical protein